MKKLSILILGGIFLSVTGCSSIMSTIDRTEHMNFTSPSRVRRVDGGWKNKSGQTRIQGHFNKALQDPGAIRYKSTEKDSSSFFEDTVVSTTTYKSISVEPDYAFGIQITHSLSDNFAIGGSFDGALSRELTHTEFTSDYNHTVSNWQFGFHMRFTKTRDFLTVAYRPEISTGSLSGMSYIEEYTDDVFSTDTIEFERPFLAFQQNLSVRVDFLDMIGIFTEFQHGTVPIAIVNDRIKSNHAFNAIFGAELTLLDLFSISPSYSMPLFQDFTGTHFTHGFAIKTSLIF